MNETLSPASYRNGKLVIDGVDALSIAEAFGTPVHCYSRAALEQRWRAYHEAFGSRRHQICYAVKANDNLSILKTLHDLGASFDIVSGGELSRVLAIGANPEQVVFSGVGKSHKEIEAALKARVGCINIESDTELRRAESMASALDVDCDVAVRVNPDVDAGTHPYISTGLKENKFGVPISEALELYRTIHKGSRLRPVGIACHIGSQLTSIAPVVDAVADVVQLADRLAADGIEVTHIDVGGGLGISYHEETPPSIEELVTAICEVVPENYRIDMEPGRSLIGKSGVLLTTVEYIKRTVAKNFAIVDAAMTELLRPSLYQAWHDVMTYEASPDAPSLPVDIVGPVCESGDWLAQGRSLAIAEGDLLAILDTGAYGAVMSSNYNARPRAAEVLVDDRKVHLVRARQTAEDMMANEVEHLIEY
ncbi:MAG: diaminopimelate decarboxylase [Gammaproteobacteria bacterium]